MYKILDVDEDAFKSSSENFSVTYTFGKCAAFALIRLW